MPIVEYLLCIIITVLLVIIIYKDGKEKEAIRNFEFMSAELSTLTKTIQEKNEEIKKLKENNQNIEDNNNDIEIL